MKKLSFLFVVVFLSIFTMTSVAAEVEETVEVEVEEAAMALDGECDYYCCVDQCIANIQSNAHEICSQYGASYCYEMAYLDLPPDCQWNNSGACMDVFMWLYNSCMNSGSWPGYGSCIWDYTQGNYVLMVCQSGCL